MFVIATNCSYLVFAASVAVSVLPCISASLFCASSILGSCSFCSLAIFFLKLSILDVPFLIASCVSCSCRSLCWSSLSSIALFSSFLSCVCSVFSLLSPNCCSISGRSSCMYRKSFSAVSIILDVVFVSSVPSRLSLTAGSASASASSLLRAFCVSCRSLAVQVRFSCFEFVSNKCSRFVVVFFLISASFRACAIVSAGIPADSRVLHWKSEKSPHGLQVMCSPRCASRWSIVPLFPQCLQVTLSVVSLCSCSTAKTRILTLSFSHGASVVAVLGLLFASLSMASWSLVSSSFGSSSAISVSASPLAAGWRMFTFPMGTYCSSSCPRLFFVPLASSSVIGVPLACSWLCMILLVSCAFWCASCSDVFM